MKMLLKYISIISLTAFLCLSLNSCYYDNLEELNPTDTSAVSTCDTTISITYATHIAPIMQNYCTSCHSGTSASGGIKLDNYDGVKNIGVNGKLYGSITWDGSASRMPKGASSKIDDCAIQKISKWISTNYSQ